jgi:hypothetical protein
MSDLGKRLRRTFSRMAAHESLAETLDKDTSAMLLEWGEVIAKQLVMKTSQMEDDDANEYLAPYASALHKMMRAIGHWAIETDEDKRLEWWNLIEQNGKTLYGDSFILPDMEVSVSRLPAGADMRSAVAFVQRLVENRRAL